MKQRLVVRGRDADAAPGGDDRAVDVIDLGLAPRVEVDRHRVAAVDARSDHAAHVLPGVAKRQVDAQRLGHGRALVGDGARELACARIVRDDRVVRVDQRGDRVDRGVGDQLPPQVRADVVGDRTPDPGLRQQLVHRPNRFGRGAGRADDGRSDAEPARVAVPDREALLVGDADDQRNVAPQRSLDRFFVSEAVLQRDDRRRRVELTREGPHRVQRVGRLDEHEEKIRGEHARRIARRLDAARRKAVERDALARDRLDHVAAHVDQRDGIVLGERVGEERPHRSGAQDRDACRWCGLRLHAHQ